MGIYDREYVRREPPRPGSYGTGGMSGMRMWSVTTWLIVICVAVFFIDRMTPLSFLPWGMVGSRTVENFDELDRSALTYKDAVRGVREVYLGDVKVGEQYGTQMHLLEKHLHFSTRRGFRQVEFWRLLGFQFLHASGPHLFFNCLGLFFFGPIVERYLGRKRYLAFYLLCGIFGALMYVLLNLGGVQTNLKIPGLLFNDPSTPLVGASAGVFGILMAGAYLAPRQTVLLMLIFPVPLRVLAYALVCLAVLTVVTSGRNAGGEASHLGGALAGFYFIRNPRHLHGFFDLLGRADPTSHHYRQRPSPRPGSGPSKSQQDKIDRILDKVHEKGIQSLTKREKRLLQQSRK